MSGGKDGAGLHALTQCVRRLENYGVVLAAGGFNFASIMVGPVRLTFQGLGPDGKIETGSAPQALLDTLEQLSAVAVCAPDQPPVILDVHDVLRKIQTAPCLTPTEHSVLELLLRTVFRG